MNKSDLIKDLSLRLNLTQKECNRFLDTWQKVVSEKLQQNESLIIQGFGTFSRWEQTERAGRNPRTGELCRIRPRTSVKFKPGKRLLAKLNS